MAQNFKIDAEATFAGPLMFVQSVPKNEFGTDKQQTFKDGTPKWEVHLLGMFHGFNGVTPEIVKVGIGQHGDPGQGIPQNSPVQLPGLEVGVMEKTKKLPDGTEKVIGVTVWHRAEGMHAVGNQAAASAPASSRRGASSDEKEKQPA